MYLILTSPRSVFDPAEQQRLQDLGYEVAAHRGRYVATRQITDLQEVTQVWDQELFHTPHSNPIAEWITVEFRGTTGWETKLLDGSAGRVLMMDPTDPLHSDLFPFHATVDPFYGMRAGKQTAALTAQLPQTANPDDLQYFMRALRACHLQFVHGKTINAQFLNRKLIRQAKRRFLFWLERENNLDPETSALVQGHRAKAKRYKEEIGFLRGVDAVWEQIVQNERLLASL